MICFSLLIIYIFFFYLVASVHFYLGSLVPGAQSFHCCLLASSCVSFHSWSSYDWTASALMRSESWERENMRICSCICFGSNPSCQAKSWLLGQPVKCPWLRYRHLVQSAGIWLREWTSVGPILSTLVHLVAPRGSHPALMQTLSKVSPGSHQFKTSNVIETSSVEKPKFLGSKSPKSSSDD